MVVLKFGGTSVGTSESLANVKKIVESLDQEAVVVVSALGGLTDRLIATAKAAASGRSDFLNEWESMAARHFRIIDDMITDPVKHDATIRSVSTLLEELKRLYEGISLIEYLPPTTLDRIVSIGERISSIIVANMIEGASHVDSLEIIKTEKWFDKDIASVNITNSLIVEKFRSLHYPAVMGGFISRDVDSDRITNLGRGGSDYTAALVAAALDAEVLQIWTDVDGFLTADPRIVKEARVMEEMSFVESMDLCSFGAKVIYPPTIYPVFHKNIPIRILNTHRPEVPGTLITDHPHRNDACASITGLSALKGENLLILSGKAAGAGDDISARSFSALSRKGLTARSQTSDLCKESFILSLPASARQEALRLLNEEFAPELACGDLDEIKVYEDVAAIAAVGDNIRKDSQLSKRIINLLREAGIEPLAYSDKSSETTLSFIIPGKDVDRALNLLHSSLLSPRPVRVEP